MEIKIAEKISVNNPAKVAQVLQRVLEAEDENDHLKEHFWAIGLDSRNTIKYLELVSLGSLESSIVHPRETFRLAVMKAVASIIIAHNHPSDDLEPSEADLIITRRLIDAGKILGIEVIDHIIIAGKGFTSFKNKKLI